MGAVKELIHDGGSSLSDHDPIIVRFKLIAQMAVSTKTKSSYFKANSGLLKKEELVYQLRMAWEVGTNVENEPHVRFFLASMRLREKLIEIQKAPSDREAEVKLLKSKLCTLKQSLILSYSDTTLRDNATTEEQVWVAEHEEAQYARRLARINWLGQGDEPSKFYFATVKAKRMRENMPSLLLEDGRVLTEGDQILEEVEWQGFGHARCRNEGERAIHKLTEI